MKILFNSKGFNNDRKNKLQNMQATSNLLNGNETHN